MVPQGIMILPSLVVDIFFSCVCVLYFLGASLLGLKTVFGRDKRKSWKFFALISRVASRNDTTRDRIYIELLYQESIVVLCTSLAEPQDRV